MNKARFLVKELFADTKTIKEKHIIVKQIQFSV